MTNTGPCLEVLVDPGIADIPVVILQRVAAFVAVADVAMPAGEWAVTLRLTDDARISTIHDRFFGDPSPTDVISFPSGDDLTADSGYLGDIVVSVETAAANAIEVGHSVDREIAFLLLHGLLHLCGLDDATDAERSAMLARQTTILEAFERQSGWTW